MYGVEAVSKCINSIELAFLGGNLGPLKMCVACILNQAEKSDFVEKPHLAARVKRLLTNEEVSKQLGTERVQKAVELLLGGPLGNKLELVEASLNHPEHVQKVVAELVQDRYGSSLYLRDYTPEQLFDILSFALETGIHKIFDKAASKVFGMDTIARDGSALVIGPGLLPVYLENSSRGAFLRSHCHGIMMGKQCPEMQLLLRYLPQDQRPHLTTLWITGDDATNRMEAIKEILSFAGPIRRLVIHGDSVERHVKGIREVLDLLPQVKEVVFDGVSWWHGWFACSCFLIPQEFYDKLKNYTVSLREVSIMGKTANEKLGEIVKLPQEEGTNWSNVTVVAEPMDTAEDDAEPVKPRDRIFDSDLLTYFIPEIVTEINAGDRWFLDHVLKHVDKQICYDTIKAPELRTRLFTYAQKRFVEGKITLETIRKLVENARYLNQYKDGEDINWFSDPQCESVVFTKYGERVSWPTLPLMAETGSPHPFENYLTKGNLFHVTTAVLQTIRSWLLKPHCHIDITGRDLMNLDALPALLMFGTSEMRYEFEKKLRGRYTATALQALDKCYIDHLLDRVPTEAGRLEFITKATARSYSTTEYDNGLYLQPEDLLKHVNTPSPWEDKLRERLKGVATSGWYDCKKLIKLMSFPEALALIKEIHWSGYEALSMVTPFTESCPNLERVVLGGRGELTQNDLKELTQFKGHFTLQLDSRVIQLGSEEERWTDLGIDPNIQVKFRGVSYRQGENGKVHAIDYSTPYLEGSSVQILPVEK